MHYSAIVLIVCLCGGSLRAQAPDTAKSVTAKSVPHWYDTLQVTIPKDAQPSTADRLRVAAFSLLSLPVWLMMGTVTILPPGGSVILENDTLYGGMAVSTGVGFGHDGTPLMWYPSVRLQLEAAWYFKRPHPFVYRLSALHDITIMPLNSKGLYWLSVAVGGGVSTDFHGTSLYGEFLAGVSNPLGIRFLGLYPMHNFGIRYRAGTQLSGTNQWHEVSLCATSNFGWFTQ